MLTAQRKVLSQFVERRVAQRLLDRM